MSIFSDIIGSTKGYFRLGLAGVRLSNDSGALKVLNAGGTVDAAITASAVNISGDTLSLNSDALSENADWNMTISRPVAGMTEDVDYVLPAVHGSSGQVLSNDGAGTLQWVSAANTALCDKVDTTSLAFGSNATVAMFSKGAADVINRIEVIVDTLFNGTTPIPNMSVGVSGTPAKYAASTDIDLTAVGVYQIHPGLPAGGAEDLIITFAAATAAQTTGAARVNVYYCTPA